MSAAKKLNLSPQEYLARERTADFKSEYYRGEAFAMAGASAAHTLIVANLAAELRQQLKKGSCRVYPIDLRLKVSPSGLYTYPDVSVVCEEPKFEDEVFDTLLNPRIIVEVLSDSTEKYDRGEKFRSYRTLQSLHEYVLVSQKEPLAETYVRQPDVAWLLSTFAGIESLLAFRTVPASVPLAEIYAGVTFTAGSDGSNG